MKKAVLFCSCGGSLDAVLPVERLKKTLAAVAPGLSFFPSARLCSAEGAMEARALAQKAGAEAVVAAGCALSARGLDAGKLLASGGDLFLEWVDLRESCAWIHAHAPEEALHKAADLIRMGFAAQEERLLAAAKPAQQSAVPQEALVMGGGPAGLACAAALARAGVPVVLAERRGTLGGMLPQLGKLFPYLTSGSDLAGELARDAEESGARILLETTVLSARPEAGGYRAVLRGKNGEEEKLFGAVVLAAGASPVLPRGYFRYGQLAGVTSQMELETQLGRVERGEKDAAALPRRAVFVQCVAARDDKNPYCSAVCCPTALKNALRLRALRPDGEVTVVQRNVVTPGRHLEDLYRRATGAGVRVRVMDPAVTPEALGVEKLEGLRFQDALSGAECSLPADALVCSTPLKPFPGTTDLAKGLGLRLDDLGFVCGREPIQPLSPHCPGVFVCGAARWPAIVEHSLEQGRAVAVKAAAYLRGQDEPAKSVFPHWNKTVGELLPGGRPRDQAAYVEESFCCRCGRCASACPYGACVLPPEGAMRVDAWRCAQCGSCVATCPNGAARLPLEGLPALRARAREALKNRAWPKGPVSTLVFACRWCALIGAERAGRERLPLPTDFRMIPVECSGAVPPDLILKAFAEGAEGVAVLGCHLGGCRHNEANRHAHARLEMLGAALEALGVRRERLFLSWGTVHEAKPFAAALTGFQNRIRALRMEDDLPLLRGVFGPAGRPGPADFPGARP